MPYNFTYDFEIDLDDENIKCTSNEDTFIRACSDGNLDLINWIYFFDNSINLSILDELPLYLACEYDNIHVVKWLLENNKKIDIFKNNIIMFNCNEGNLEIMKLLYNFNNHIVNIENRFKLFELACKYCFLDIAEWLITIDNDIEINQDKDSLFRFAIETDNISLAIFLTSIRPECYHISILDDEIVGYEIMKTLLVKKDKKIMHEKIENCFICYENNSNIITECNHFFCYDCLSTHYNVNSYNCPYCRKHNFESNLYNII